MSNRGFVDRSRETEYLSAKIFGEDRIKKVKTYCKTKNINTRAFFEELIDNFFKSEKAKLLLLSKEDLIEMILMKGEN